MLLEATPATKEYLQPHPAQATPYQLWKREQARQEIRRAAKPWKRSFRRWLSLALQPGSARAQPQEAHPNAATNTDEA